MVEHEYLPGKWITKLMHERNVSEDQLAHELDISRGYLNHIKNNRRPITESLAISLQKISEISSEEWLEAQKSYSPKKGNEGKLIERWRLLGGRILTDYEIMEATNAGMLIIRDFDVSRIQPCGYDLTNYLASDAKEVTLNPDESLVVHSKEKILMPSCLYGQLDVVGSALHEHSLMVHIGGRLHPGWGEQSIKYRITNISERAEVVSINTALVGIHFHFLPVEPKKLLKSDSCHATGKGQSTDDYSKLSLEKLMDMLAEQNEKRNSVKDEIQRRVTLR